jgi:FtsZ-binding cell division protein ZapB
MSTIEGSIVDNEFILEQFGKIESKVEQLIGTFRSYELKNSELISKIKSLEEELQSRTEAEERYAEEKALIRSKIDGLMAKLDEILQD